MQGRLVSLRRSLSARDLHSRRRLMLVTAVGAILLLTAANSYAGVPAADTQSGYGPNPVLPSAETSWIPVVNVARAIGWPQGGRPIAAKGFAVEAFACGLAHPRWVTVLPNGDVLVTESNKPARRDDALVNLREWFSRYFMRRAGSSGASADRITLLRDANGDGVPENRSVFLDGLHSPFGVALAGGDLFVANTDALVRFPYKTGDTRISAAGTHVVDLPDGEANRHWTKNVIASRDGLQLYVTVGSDSNAAEHGMEREAGRAAILEVDARSGAVRTFASGLRNPNGMGWQPQTGELWTVVNERDELGTDLVPDYLTSVKDGGFYGWPYSYFGQNLDPRVKTQRPDLVARAIKPDYAVGNHTASLGLAFYEGRLFEPRYSGGAFIGQHGSWNRKPLSGYKVIFVPFANGHPSGMPEDILTGFLNIDGEAFGRPVGVAIDRTGALLVADDVGNCVWRVAPAKP
jgi:glucose/arabinose dehydrogenase